jgi:hypothetical protein
MISMYASEVYYGGNANNAQALVEVEADRNGKEPCGRRGSDFDTNKDSIFICSHDELPEDVRAIVRSQRDHADRRRKKKSKTKKRRASRRATFENLRATLKSSNGYRQDLSDHPKPQDVIIDDTSDVKISTLTTHEDLIKISGKVMQGGLHHEPNNESMHSFYSTVSEKGSGGPRTENYAESDNGLLGPRTTENNNLKESHSTGNPRFLTASMNAPVNDLIDAALRQAQEAHRTQQHQ